MYGKLKDEVAFMRYDVESDKKVIIHRDLNVKVI